MKKNDKVIQKPAGFTLIELMISIALAGIVVAVATTAVLGITKHTKAMAEDVQLDDDAKLLMETILPDLQSAGGANIWPWMAINVANNAGYNGSDVLTVSILDSSFRECNIIRYDFSNLFIEGTDTNNDGIWDSCCLEPGNYASHRLLVSNPSNTQWITAQITGVTRTGAPTVLGSLNCSINGYSNVLPELSNIGFPNPFTWAPGVVAPPGPFGTIGVVRVYEIYMNASNQLVRREIITGTPSDLTRILADQVYDFQVSLGYDAPPADGHITEANSTMDEWLYNVAGDGLGTSLGTPSLGTRSAAESDLRMVKVAVVHGIKSQGGGSVRAFDGPSVNGFSLTPPMKLRVATGAVVFRNLFLFQ